MPSILAAQGTFEVSQFWAGIGVGIYIVIGVTLFLWAVNNTDLGRGWKGWVPLVSVLSFLILTIGIAFGFGGQ